MAYAAVISLKQTIQRLLNSSHISIVSSSQEILEVAYNELTSLQQALQRLDDSSSSKRLNDLDGQIRESIHKLEDLLEFHMSNQFLSESDSHRDLGLEEVRQDVNSLMETVKKMKEDYIKELENPLAEEEEDADAAVSSNIGDFGVEMVGLSDVFASIRDKLLRGTRPDDFAVFSFVGRPGTGRTIAARIIFEELYISKQQHFGCGAWVTIGPNSQYKRILVSILAQILLDDDIEFLISEGDEKLGEHLYTSLKGRRYIIVLDDIRDTRTWDQLRRLFPEQNNGSLVLLTTETEEAALFANSFHVFYMPDFDEDPTWDFLRLMLFDGQSCPPQVEEAGKKIVENCRCLRLPLAKVVLFLSTTKKTPDCWNLLAEDKDNPIFVVADEMSELRKIKDMGNSLPDDDDRALTVKVVSRVMHNLYSLIGRIKMQMFPERLFPKSEIFSFHGMAGIGKTALVKKIFEDPLISCHFDHRVWVTLGPKYQPEEILIDILSQTYPDIDIIYMKGDEKFADLCGQLSYKRCLIVLDDIWNKEPLYYLQRLLPDIKGEILMTTRQAKVAIVGKHDIVYKMQLLNEEQSWSLLCQKVFAKASCPPELEKAGKMISKNCEGLPLLIRTVADHLSKSEMTLEYWNNVAKKQNPIFMNAYHEMSGTLRPSYNCLPEYLKACFLYMGVFPQNYEIPTSKLIKLWIVERFLEPNPAQAVTDFAMECLSELVDRSLVMLRQKGSNFKIKTCSLHFVFWHLSNDEAMKNKLFHSLNSYIVASMEGIEIQRRLCVRNNVLLGIKDVHDSIESISTARSLLCTGSPHQYPVPIYFNLRLLRVLDALTIRFYEFPIEVVKLIHLTYLALTCNGKVPASISKLWNLQYLIVSRHLIIKFFEDSSYLPVEIWGMKELKHLQIMGGCLPNPDSSSVLPNLVALLDVSARSCTERVFKKIPNLKRLGIQIDIELDDDGKPFLCLNHIFHFHQLESLKCVVVNPMLGTEVVAPPAPLSMFPSTLKKLSLSGLGYPWEYMSIIGKLQNLEVLKLRCYAFRGSQWSTNYREFRKLKYLLIEDTDLVCWKLKIPGFQELEHLSIKHCYKLEELPRNFVSPIRMIEVVDCNPFVVTWGKQMKEKHSMTPFGMAARKLQVHSSWEARN